MNPAVDPSWTTKFIENGVIGICVIVLAIVVWKLARAYNRIQETRIDEAKAVTDRILKLAEEWQESQNDLTSAVGRHADNVTQLRDECRERTEGVAMMIREMIKDLRAYVDEVRKRLSRGGG